jgi:hypothetical protein
LNNGAVAGAFAIFIDISRDDNPPPSLARFENQTVRTGVETLFVSGRLQINNNFSTALKSEVIDPPFITAIASFIFSSCIRPVFPLKAQHA